MAFKFLQSLGADDIFISYSRADGEPYLKGMQAALSARGFSCFSDRLGTDAGEKPPDTLYEKVRSCKTLVLLGTPGAIDRPENITPELDEFAKVNGTARIICVSFDRETQFAPFPKSWRAYAVGKARVREPPEALTTGAPSPDILQTVADASNYMKSKDRLRRYRNSALAVLSFLTVAIVVAAVIATFMFKLANDATNKANVETEKANAATERATQATQAAQAAQDAAHKAQDEADAARDDAEKQKAEADRQKVEAQKQKAEADRQKAEASKQKELADRATKDAIEKTKLAEEAALRAREAEKRAEREQAIADARSLANSSQTLLRQRPEELPRAVSLAVDSMKKFTSVGLHGVEADTALRDALAQLPNLRVEAKHDLAADYGKDVALSPDGRHFAAVEDDGKLRVYTSDGKKLLNELDCRQCAEVALSSGPSHAAAIVQSAAKTGAVRIFDLKGGTAPRDIPTGVTPYHIALSPGGRYLAVTSDYGGDGDRQSMLMVLEVAGEKVKVVKSFDAPTPEGDEGEGAQAAASDCAGLDMLINDVAFGPTGNLAVGGKYKTPQGGREVGRVVVWPLTLKAEGEADEPELTDASFFLREAVQQEREVEAVAPGADATTFATERAVWKRMSGRVTYEPVARLPVLPDSDYRLGIVGINDVQKLAFAPDGKSLSVVRLHLNTGQDPYAMVRHDLEVWDASGHRELSQSFQNALILNIAFGQGGEFFFTRDFIPTDAWRFRVFRTAGGAEAARVETDSESDTSVHFNSYTGHFVNVVGDAAEVRGARDGSKRIARFGAALSEVKTAALSPGADLLALFGPSRQGGAPTLTVYRAEGDAFVESKLLPAAALPGWSYDNPSKLALSADGRVVAAHFSRGSRGYVRVFDLADGRDLTTESLKSLDTLSSMTLSPSGRLVAVAQVSNVASQRQNGKVLLIDLNTGSVVTLANDTVLASFAFSRDGRLLGVGTADGLLRVFDTERPDEEVARLEHTGAVTAVSFSDDGKYVATASSDPHRNQLDEEESFPLRIWLLRPDDLIAEAAARMKSLGRYAP